MFEHVGRLPRAMSVFGTSGDTVICEDFGFKEHVERGQISPADKPINIGDTVYVWSDKSYHLVSEG